MPGPTPDAEKNVNLHRWSDEIALGENPSGKLNLEDVSSIGLTTQFPIWPQPGDVNLAFNESAKDIGQVYVAAAFR